MTHENHSAELSARGWRRLKQAALSVSLLLVACIVGLMVLAAGKDEDIAGIVAPALLLALAAGVVAMVAAYRQKRARNRC